ncbi:MAG: polyprenyl synthetase family protein [Arcobacteraceae bacterium]
MKLDILFEEYLLTHLPKSKSFHPIFENALQEMIQAGGKRFRPLLLLSVVKSYQSLLLKNALSVALGVELLHTYSLIHDDLPAMDNASLRRGYPTLHTTYDEVTAILVGDALNTHSFNLIANAPLSNDVKIELIQLLSNDGGINGMIIGQAIDCYFENQTIALEELEFLHTHKTAKLIAASLKMGAIICNLPHELQEELYLFGTDIGLLFQIQDDIIDETHTSLEAGKTTNNDASKNSFVNLLGLDGAINSANKLAKKCEVQLSSFDEILQNNLKPLLEHYLYRHQ